MGKARKDELTEIVKQRIEVNRIKYKNEERKKKGPKKREERGRK